MPRDLTIGGVNVYTIAGQAIVLTFASGIVIFVLERLGLYVAAYCDPNNPIPALGCWPSIFPYLTSGETLLALFFFEWLIWAAMIAGYYTFFRNMT